MIEPETDLSMNAHTNGAPQTLQLKAFEAATPAIFVGERRPQIGVVGCGYWGSKYLRLLCSSSNVGAVAIIDTDAGVRQSISAAFPLVRVFQTIEQALPHLDAIIVATPPCTHFSIAFQCLRNGKHVLVEKPMARSMQEGCTLIKEARQSNVVLMVGHTFEFNPAVRELKRRIKRGDLGRIRYLHSSRLNLGLYRSDVNVVWDLAPHDISIMNYLLDATPSSVSAWGSASEGAGTEYLAYMRFEYRGLGVIGYARISWLDPNKVREVIVVGSGKMAIYNDLIEERLRIYDRGVAPCKEHGVPFERPLTYRYGDIVSPYIEFHEPLSLEVNHFIECVQSSARPLADGYSGLAVIAVLEAIDEAIETGRVVEVHYEHDEAKEGTASHI
jgi:predicted dehydrogenase